MVHVLPRTFVCARKWICFFLTQRWRGHMRSPVVVLHVICRIWKCAFAIYGMTQAWWWSVAIKCACVLWYCVVCVGSCARRTCLLIRSTFTFALMHCLRRWCCCCWRCCCDQRGGAADWFVNNYTGCGPAAVHSHTRYVCRTLFDLYINIVFVCHIHY